jgi:hypothetical protein
VQHYWAPRPVVGTSESAIYGIRDSEYLVPGNVHMDGYPSRKHIIRVPKEVNGIALRTNEAIGAAAHLVIDAYYRTAHKLILFWPREIGITNPAEEITQARLDQFVQNRRRQILAAGVDQPTH